MELRQLAYFLAIAEDRNMSKAASRLFIAQSALSYQISRLEQEFETILFHRSAKGVRLTESGEVFLEKAQSILGQVRDTRNVMSKFLRNSHKETVVVGMPSAVSMVLAVPLLLAAKRELPDVFLQMTADFTYHTLDKPQSNKVDVALLYDHGQFEEFKISPLVEEQMYLVWSKLQTPKGIVAPISINDLKDIPLILPSRECRVRKMIEQHVHDSGYQLGRVVTEMNSLEMIKGAILAGVGASILPLSTIVAEMQRGELVIQEIPDPGLFQKISIYRSPNYSPTKASIAITSLINEIAQQLCKSGEWASAVALGNEENSSSANPIKSKR